MAQFNPFKFAVDPSVKKAHKKKGPKAAHKKVSSKKVGIKAARRKLT